MYLTDVDATIQSLGSNIDLDTYFLLIQDASRFDQQFDSGRIYGPTVPEKGGVPVPVVPDYLSEIGWERIEPNNGLVIQDYADNSFRGYTYNSGSGYAGYVYKRTVDGVNQFMLVNAGTKDGPGHSWAAGLSVKTALIAMYLTSGAFLGNSTNYRSKL